MATRTPYDFVALVVPTAAQLNSGAKGWLGDGANATDQTGITGTVDITNVTTTVVVGATRLVKVTAQCHVTAVAGTATYYVTVQQDGVALGRIGRVTLVASGDVTQLHGAVYVKAPSAGSHTYKLVITLAAGTATSLTVDGSTPATILVEDCGSTV